MPQDLRSKELVLKRHQAEGRSEAQKKTDAKYFNA
jgi:hypothetical protein